MFSILLESGQQSLTKKHERSWNPKIVTPLISGTNGCLDLRYRAFPLGGQVSAECSIYPGSMARRARDSVASL